MSMKLLEQLELLSYLCKDNDVAEFGCSLVFVEKKNRSSQFKGEKEENAGDQSGILWEMGNIGKEEILEK
jgi:hypothetical protein